MKNLPAELKNLKPGELELLIREAVLAEARPYVLEHQSRWIYERLKEADDARTP